MKGKSKTNLIIINDWTTAFKSLIANHNSSEDLGLFPRLSLVTVTAGNRDLQLFAILSSQCCGILWDTVWFYADDQQTALMFDTRSHQLVAAIFRVETRPLLISQKYSAYLRYYFMELHQRPEMSWGEISTSRSSWKPCGLGEASSCSWGEEQTCSEVSSEWRLRSYWSACLYLDWFLSSVRWLSRQPGINICKQGPRCPDILLHPVCGPL